MDNQAAKSLHPRISINQLLCELHTRLSEHADELNMLADHLRPIRNLRRAQDLNHKEEPFENASYIEDIIGEAIRRVKSATNRAREVRCEIALEPLPEESVPTPEREVTYAVPPPTGVFRPGRP
jgi:hypothetical protein